MKFAHLGCLLVFLFAQHALAQGDNTITNGMSRAGVIEQLGPPKGALKAGTEETLLFANAKVLLRNGIVVSCTLTPTPPAGTPPTRPPSAVAPPPAPSASAGDTDAGWETDFAKATAAAAQSHRALLLDFTGSDWCHFCIKLDEEVFRTPEFKTFAADRFICVRLDFPRKHAQSDALRKQNAELYKTFEIRGFPSIVILSPEGVLIGKQVGYQGNRKQYLAQLDAMLKDAAKKHADR